MMANDRIAHFMLSMVAKLGSSRLQSDLNRREFGFGDFTFQPDTRRLLRNRKPVGLNGKAFDLLATLLESHGRILTREELYERLWGDRVVEDANLSQTVYLLRRALDPHGDGRAFIETVPRIGYRFAQPVRKLWVPAPPRLERFVMVAVALCAVVLTVMPWESAGRRYEISTAARNADQLGEYHLALRTPDHLSYALAYFKDAERAAPRDAFAYAEAAAAYALLAEFQAEGSARQHELVSLALASSAAALRRETELSRALAVRGFVAYRFQNDRNAAARYLSRSLVADPNDSEAHLWHGVLLMMEGDLIAATAEIQTARRIAPTSEVYSRWLSRSYAFDRKPELAIAEARETLRIEPDDAPATLVIAQAQEQRGDLQSAAHILRMLLRKDPYERAVVVPDLLRLELRIGKTSRTLVRHRVELLSSARADPFEIALLYLTMGRKAAGMQMLRRVNRSMLAIQRYDPRLLALL